MCLQDIKNITDLFETLKDKKDNHTANAEVDDRLKNITAEVEKMAKDVEDKMKKIEGLCELCKHTLIIILKYK